MSVREFTVDLDRSPEDRWAFLGSEADSCRRMLKAYVDDLGGLDQFGSILEEYADAHVPPVYLAEMEGIAGLLKVPRSEVLLANLYYDAMIFVLGCTAFAIDTENGPLHARNLDWWSPGTALSDQTLIYRFVRNGTHRFSTISWPGFMGALSGIAPGRFTVTLNAVLSDERPPLALAVTLLLRQVLERAETYDEAVRLLAETTVVSSSLLLVSGTQPGEMCVIERTPTRHRIREPKDGFVVVTNDYRLIDPDKPAINVNELQETSCGRFDRASSLVASTNPSSVKEAITILRDEAVRMKITAQHMVFRANDGLTYVETPSQEPTR